MLYTLSNWALSRELRYLWANASAIWVNKMQAVFVYMWEVWSYIGASIRWLTFIYCDLNVGGFVYINCIYNPLIIFFLFLQAVERRLSSMQLQVRGRRMLWHRRAAQVIWQTVRATLRGKARVHPKGGSGVDAQIMYDMAWCSPDSSWMLQRGRRGNETSVQWWTYTTTMPEDWYVWDIWIFHQKQRITSDIG